MIYSKAASDTGWAILVGTAFFSSILGCLPFVFHMGLAWTIVWYLLVGAVAATLGVYAVLNIRSKGVFVSKLTNDEYVQSVPLRLAGESFGIKLSDITQIEIHDAGVDGRNDQWYLHTPEGRFQISSHYGNPHRKIGAAIRKTLPHIPTIET